MASESSPDLLESILLVACAELESRLGAGERGVASQLLTDEPRLADHEDSAIELIYREFVTLERLGNVSSKPEFAARFPRWQERILRLLELHDVLGPDDDRAYHDTISPRGAHTPTDSGMAPADILGDRIAQFEILGELGRGGMGIVYRALDTELGRTVALKVIRSHDQRTRRQLRREAESVARLHHPNIVQIFQVGESGDWPYFAMEFVDGGTLDESISSARPAAEPAALIVETLATAMHAAHQAGVLHRDLKPANVLLTQDGHPKIADFGLAKQLSGSDRTLTATVMGTPSYMAPEQAGQSSESSGVAVDVYSLGAILYELLTGRPPFLGDSVFETLDQVRTREPVVPSLLQPNVPRDLETICLKCLCKEPHRRYPQAADLAEDLRRFRAGEPIVARPVGALERSVKWIKRRPTIAGLIAAVIVIAGLGVGGVVWQWQRADTKRQAAETAYQDAQRARDAERRQRERIETDSYFRRVALAQREWVANYPHRARQILEQCPVEQRSWEWHYLNSRMHSDVRTFIGHKEAIIDLAFTADGKRVASCGGESGGPAGEVILWDVANTKLLNRWRPPWGRMRGVAFNPDGSLLAAAGYGVQLFDGRTGEPLGMLSNSPGDQRRIIGHTHVAFHPAGKLLAGAGGDGLVRIWDMQTRTVARTLEAHTNTVWNVAFHPDGKRLASISHDGSFCLWRVDDGKLLHRINAYGDGRRVCFSPNGRYVGTVGYGRLGDQTVNIWDLAARKKNDTESPLPVEVARRTMPADAIPDIAFSHDSQYVFVSGGGGGVRVWEPATGSDVAIYRAHSGSAHGVAMAGDGRWLASIGADRHVKIWDRTRELDEVLTTATDGSAALEFALNPEGTRAAVAGGLNVVRYGVGSPKIWLWNLKHRRADAEFVGHTKWVNSVCFSSAGDWLASGSDDQTVRIWNSKSRKCVGVLVNHKVKVTRVAFLAKDKLLASADKNGIVRLWDTSVLTDHSETPDITMVREITAHQGAINHLAIPPSGEVFVTAGEDQTVRVWDPATGQEVATLRRHAAPVLAVVFSPDENWLASADSAGVAAIWKCRRTNGKPLDFDLTHSLTNHTHRIKGLAFTSDSRRLATGAAATMKLWDTETGQEVISLRLKKPTECIRFSPDGLRLISSHGPTIVTRDATLRPFRESLDRETEPTSRLVAWHERDIARMNRCENWEGVRMHLRRLVKLKPKASTYPRQMADTLGRLGNWDAALERYRRAAELATDESFSGSQRLSEAYGLYWASGRLRIARGEEQSALLLKRAIGLVKPLLAETPVSYQPRADLARYYRNLASDQKQLGQNPQADASYQRAIRLYEDLAKEYPSKTSLISAQSIVRLNHNVVLRRLKRYQDAEKSYLRAISLDRSLVMRFPKKGNYRSSLALGLDDFATLKIVQADWKAADKLGRESLALREDLTRKYPDDNWYLEGLARSRRTMAKILTEGNQLPEARKLREQVAEAWQELVNREPTNSHYVTRAISAYSVLLTHPKRDRSNPQKTSGWVARLVALRLQQVKNSPVFESKTGATPSRR